MKIKKFNEQLDAPEQGPEDRSKIDPYGEENWSDNTNDKKYNNTPGVCIHCGSENLEWTGQDIFADQMYYRYCCRDCDEDGEEVYNIEFILNQAR